jgi:hypothetical protein
VKTPLLPGQTAGKTACRDPAAATAGFILNLASNSAMSGCAYIDEAPARNVSYEPNKTFAGMKKIRRTFFVLPQTYYANAFER